MQMNTQQRQPQPIRIQIKLTRLQQYRLSLIWFAILMFIAGYLFLSMDVSNPLSVFYSSNLISIVLLFFVWWFSFSVIRTAKIVPPKKPIVAEEAEPNNILPVPRKLKVEAATKPNKFDIIKKMLPLAGGIMSMCFCVWFLIIFTYAATNEEHVVVNYFDEFGEFTFEAIFVVIITIVTLIGLYYNYKRTDDDIKELKRK